LFVRNADLRALVPATLLVFVQFHTLLALGLHVSMVGIFLCPMANVGRLCLTQYGGGGCGLARLAAEPHAHVTLALASFATLVQHCHRARALRVHATAAALVVLVQVVHISRGQHPDASGFGGSVEVERVDGQPLALAVHAS